MKTKKLPVRPASLARKTTWKTNLASNPVCKNLGLVTELISDGFEYIFDGIKHRKSFNFFASYTKFHINVHQIWPAKYRERKK